MVGWVGWAGCLAGRLYGRFGRSLCTERVWLFGCSVPMLMVDLNEKCIKKVFYVLNNERANERVRIRNAIQRHLIQGGYIMNGWLDELNDYKY